MQTVKAFAAFAPLVFFPALLEAQKPAINAPAAPPTVARNLLVSTSLKLTQPAPDTGTEVTIASDDPRRLLLARTPQDEPSKSITVKVGEHYFETPNFFFVGLDEKGSATYTATAAGFTSLKGTVKFGRSAVLVLAPMRAPRLWTTPAAPQRVGFETVLIDAAGKPVERQFVGSKELRVEPIISNPAVGAFVPSTVVIPPGESMVGIDFKQAGVGSATVSVKPPAGFSTPAEFATFTARVELPGIGGAGEVTIGKDLQLPGVLLLGQPAPEGGVDVTLTSPDPARLVFSQSAEKLGTGTLTIHIGPGLATADYYLQALGSEGTLNYKISAPGYRERLAPVYLAPSGIMISYAAHGAPDEAEYKSNVRVPRPFVASVSSKNRERIALWTVYLDPVTRRGADMTAQALRPGVAIDVELKSSDPNIGTVPGKVTLSGAKSYSVAEFTALKPGQTVLTVNTPPGFLTPSNATSVTATVKE